MRLYTDAAVISANSNLIQSFWLSGHSGLFGLPYRSFRGLRIILVKFIDDGKL
jgi:hypothetical protein